MEFNAKALTVAAALAVYSITVNVNGVHARTLVGRHAASPGHIEHAPPVIGSRGPLGLKLPRSSKRDSDSESEDGFSGGIGGLGGGGGRVDGHSMGGISSEPVTAQTRELASLGLVRTRNTDEKNPSGSFEGVDEFRDATRKRYTIAPNEEKKAQYGEEHVMDYNVLVRDDGGGAFDIRYVHTTDRDLPEGTKRRDLIQNGFLDAGGDLGKVKTFGDTDIINDDVKEFIRNAFQQKGINERSENSESSDADSITYEPQTVTFTPNGNSWTEIMDNPFIGGYNKMIENEAFDHARISEITVIVEGEGETYNMRTTISRL